MLASFLLLLSLGAFAQARVQFLGIAIAGGDFGCQIDATLGGADGQGQMKHFVQDDGLNLFRLPISWQFLINSNSAASSTLDAGNAAKYDQLVQACLSTGAYCMIDVHNFARFGGGIVGQGGPSDDLFVGLWTALAAKYAQTSRVVFELANEPHDLDVGIWAQTCQKAVTAIRSAGASTQLILLPGTNFDSAATLVSSGSADALMAITNPNGTTDGLVLDVHKYLDNDNSGTHAACTTDNVGNFSLVATYLRTHGRQGLVSETGASSQASCRTDFCAQNTFINANADVFLGYVGWAAGGFDTSYVLSLTPTKQGSSYVDNALMTECVLGPFRNASLPQVQSSVATALSSTASTANAANATTSSTASTTLSTSSPFATTASPSLTSLESVSDNGLTETISSIDMGTTLITAAAATAKQAGNSAVDNGIAAATGTGSTRTTGTAASQTVQIVSGGGSVRVAKAFVLAMAMVPLFCR